MKLHVERRRVIAASLVALATAGANTTQAQEIILSGPLSSSTEDESVSVTEDGISFTVHGLSGIMIADEHPMSLAPGSDAPDVIAHLSPRLAGKHAYIGSGLRGFYQGEYVRAGGTAGVFMVDRGLTEPGGDTPAGYLLVADRSFGGHFEVFAGGQIHLGPLVPYLDVVGSLDIVHTRYQLFAEGVGLVSIPSYNAYAFGVGPRIGAIIPISSKLYLDLAAAGSVVGINRLMFTAGFGFSSASRRVPR